MVSIVLSLLFDETFPPRKNHEGLPNASIGKLDKNRQRSHREQKTETSGGRLEQLMMQERRTQPEELTKAGKGYNQQAREGGEGLCKSRTRGKIGTRPGCSPPESVQLLKAGGC